MVLIGVAFLISYWTRTRLELEHKFFLDSRTVALLLGWSTLVWIALGFWWEIYDRIEAAHSRVILTDAFRQCLLGSALVVLFEYLIHEDLSRLFLGLFAVFTWLLLSLFRLNAGRLLGAMRRGFGVPHFIMVVGLGEPALCSGQLQAA